MVFRGAQSENRTRDLRITNALLYRLSYLGALVAQPEMLSAGPRRHALRSTRSRRERWRHDDRAMTENCSSHAVHNADTVSESARLTVVVHGYIEAYSPECRAVYSRWIGAVA